MVNNCKDLARIEAAKFFNNEWRSCVEAGAYGGSASSWFYRGILDRRTVHKRNGIRVYEYRMLGPRRRKGVR